MLIKYASTVFLILLFACITSLASATEVIKHNDAWGESGFNLVNQDASGWMLKGWFDEEYSVENLPRTTALHSNYPNPFNSETVISFDLNVSGNVTLDIYNVLGQKVSTLADGRMEAGSHSLRWDASTFSSGVYFYKLTAGDKIFTKRMTMLK